MKKYPLLLLLIVSGVLLTGFGFFNREPQTASIPGRLRRKKQRL